MTTGRVLRRSWATARAVSTAVAVTVAVATAASGCTTIVPGKPTGAPGAAGSGPIPTFSAPSPTHSPKHTGRARDLLLPDGADTPAGKAEVRSLERNYFTSVEPPSCAAALLFKGSPLTPAGWADDAESGYVIRATSSYGEAAYIYSTDLDDGKVITDGFSAVGACTTDANGSSAQETGRPMRLSEFSMPTDGVLVWSMTRPDWTCHFGMITASDVLMRIFMCEAVPSFDMAAWAAERRRQIQQTAS